MPAAIAIPAIVGAGSAGASLIGAHKQASAANDAARMQSESADKALALQKQVYQDQQRRLAPFQALGNDAFARLYSEHFGVPYSSSLPGAFTPGVPLGSMGASPAPSVQSVDPRLMHAALGGAGKFMDAIGGSPDAFRQRLLDQGAIPQRAAAAYEPPSPYRPAGVPQLVRLQAPTGEVEEVPADVAEQFIAKGARRIGSGGASAGVPLGAMRAQGY